MIPVEKVFGDEYALKRENDGIYKLTTYVAVIWILREPKNSIFEKLHITTNKNYR